MAELELEQKRFLLLYGSQTGQAKAIAEIIAEQSVKKGYNPEMFCLSCLKKFNLKEETVMVMVVSTTGEGEPPDTVCKFWRGLKKKSLPSDHLSNLQYALLGLGDSNYTNFCNMGKMMNKRLLELGARPFHETGYADDGVGLELVVDPWISDLWSALEKVFISPGSQPVETHCSEPDSAGNGGSSPLSHQPSTVVQPTEHKTDAVQSYTGVTQSPQQAVDSPTLSDVSSLDSKIDNLSLEQKHEQEQHGHSDAANSHTLSDFEGTLLGIEDTSWETIPYSIPKFQHLLVSVKLIEVSDVPEFNYSESVSGALKGQNHITVARVCGRRQLTSTSSEKTTLELVLSWDEENTRVDELEADQLSYQPGDAVCVMCPNNSNEVDYILNRLQLLPVADYTMQLSIPPGTTLKNPVIPKHIPTVCTVRQYFTHCADIRAIPRKSLLSVLAACCDNDRECKRLQWLTSRQGSADFMRMIVEQHTDLLDLLSVFQSCNPTLGHLVGTLPRLQPRYYSVASSPLAGPNSFKIAFNVINLPEKRRMNLHHRMGLCSGWLDHVSSNAIQSVRVPLYPRLRNPFHLPSSPLVPLLMVGPGTGMAPFLGFLQHRFLQKSSGISVGKMWLFFGCRHPDQDFIYRDELKEYLCSSVLTCLSVSFSRLESRGNERGGEENEIGAETRTELFDVGGKYVQDNIRAHGKDVVSWIVKEHAAVYVCGDAKNMAVDVKTAFTNVLDLYQEHTAGLKVTTLADLQEDGRYLVDSWT